MPSARSIELATAGRQHLVASAVAQQLLCVAIGDRVAKPRGDVGVEPARRDDVPDARINRCANPVVMVVKHIDCFTIVRDENGRVGAAESRKKRGEIRVSARTDSTPAGMSDGRRRRGAAYSTEILC